VLTISRIVSPNHFGEASAVDFTPTRGEVDTERCSGAFKLISIEPSAERSGAMAQSKATDVPVIPIHRNGGFAMQEMPHFAEMPESVRSIMKASIDQARKAFETFISASQQAMSNFEGPTNPATDGLKQLNEKMAEYTRMNADANFRFALKLADAKQINEVIEMQNNYVRELMESYAKQMEEIRALTVRVVQDGAKTVGANMPGSGS
jgi:hypothetical protein